MRPAGAIITIFVDDLDALAAEIASRGIEPAERVTYSNGVRKAIYRARTATKSASGAPPSSGKEAEPTTMRRWPGSAWRS
jgi:hypothetical protein